MPVTFEHQIRTDRAAKQFVLGHGDLIGRLPRNPGLRVNDRSVSESHAQVSFRRGGAYLLSLRGRLWTHAGRRLPRTWKLSEGDQFYLAPSEHTALRLRVASIELEGSHAATAVPRVPVDVLVLREDETAVVYVEGFDPVFVRGKPYRLLRHTPEEWTDWEAVWRNVRGADAREDADGQRELNKVVDLLRGLLTDEGLPPGLVERVHKQVRLDLCGGKRTIP